MSRWLRFLSTLAFLAAIALPARAEIHTVNQVSTSFQPASLTIAVGDTVHWVWSAGSHTVTNGTGPTDPEAGTLFDEPLSISNPLVTYVFSSAGEVPYFCRPHFGLGMTGLIIVEEGTAAPATPALAYDLSSYPNPFNPRTKLSFSLAEAQEIRLDIFDTRGARVRSLQSGLLAAGEHTATWDGLSDEGELMASGLYLARLAGKDGAESHGLLLLK